MNHAMWISKTGIQAQDAKLQAIANNLANVNTVGFKRDRAVFEDLFYRAERQPGAQVSDNATGPGVQLGNGTRIAGTQKVFTTGAMQNTAQALDVAINGNGFLQVEMANGEVGYTRAGQLRLNDQGRLTNAQGLPIAPGIDIPQDATGITIGEKWGGSGLGDVESAIVLEERPAVVLQEWVGRRLTTLLPYDGVAALSEGRPQQ